MKKKLLLTAFGLCSALLLNLPTYAAQTQDSENVERTLIDPNGKVISETLYNTPDEEIDDTVYTVPSSNPLNRSLYLFSIGLAPYNSYRELRATSESNVAIDRIIVSCTAYYTDGVRVGSKSSMTPTGWTTRADYASVKVANTAFIKTIGSGNSSHTFRDKGVDRLYRTKAWKK